VLVRNVMHSPIIHTTSTSSLEMLQAYGRATAFPQMPVIDDGIPVGSISTDQIVASMTDQDLKKSISFTCAKYNERVFFPSSLTTDANTVSRILEKKPLQFSCLRKGL